MQNYDKIRQSVVDAVPYVVERVRLGFIRDPQFMVMDHHLIMSAVSAESGTEFRENVVKIVGMRSDEITSILHHGNKLIQDKLEISPPKLFAKGNLHMDSPFSKIRVWADWGGNDPYEFDYSGGMMNVRNQLKIITDFAKQIGTDFEINASVLLPNHKGDLSEQLEWIPVAEFNHKGEFLDQFNEMLIRMTPLNLSDFFIDALCEIIADEMDWWNAEIIRRLHNAGISIKTLTEKCGQSERMIRYIIKNQRWIRTKFKIWDHYGLYNAIVCHDDFDPNSMFPNEEEPVYFEIASDFPPYSVEQRYPGINDAVTAFAQKGHKIPKDGYYLRNGIEQGWDAPTGIMQGAFN